LRLEKDMAQCACAGLARLSPALHLH